MFGIDGLSPVLAFMLVCMIVAVIAIFFMVRINKRTQKQIDSRSLSKNEVVRTLKSSQVDGDVNMLAHS